MRKGEVAEFGVEGWKKLRDRWEYSHLVRTVLAAAALIAMIVVTAVSAP